MRKLFTILLTLVTVAAQAQTDTIPTVNAGADVVAHTGVSIHLVGSATTYNGATIASKHWTALGSPVANIVTPTGMTTYTNGYNVSGVYQFQFSVTDSHGQTGYDTVKVTIVDNPVVDAGPTQQLATSVTSATLTGTATDTSGIKSVKWTGSGGAVIVSPTSLSTSVTGIDPDSIYTFTLTATNNYSGTASDITHIRGYNTPPDTPSYQIVLNKDATFWDGDTIYYQLAGYNRYLSGEGLMANQTADTTAEDTSSIWFGSTASDAAIIDLGGYYAIKKIYFANHLSNDWLDVLYGTPQAWSTDTLTTHMNLTWKLIEPTKPIYTRYLKVFWANKDNAKNGGDMLLYGYLVRDSLSRIQPNFAYHKPDVPMSQAIGTNTTWIPNSLYNLFGAYRYYVPMGDAENPDEHDVDSLKYQVSTPSGGTLNYYFPDGEHFKSEVTLANPAYNITKMVEDNGGIFWYSNISWDPFYGNQAGNVNFPVDITAHPDRDSSDPYNYDRISNKYWLSAAVYGSNSIPKDSLYQVTYPDTSDYGVLRYIEPGNEYDNDWSSKGMIPHVFAAYLSATYDGNGNTMGYKYGIKNGSPTTKVIEPGLARGMANAHFREYSRNLYFWAQQMRPTGNQVLPFDIANFHMYSNANGQAVTPESDSARVDIRAFYDMINRQSHGTVPIWWTEFGYDWSGSAGQSVPVNGIGTMNKKILQGIWTVRYLLAGSGYVDVFTQYQLLDIDTSANGAIYSSSGMLAGWQDGLGRHHYYPNPSFYYMETFRHVLGNYVFDREVRRKAGDSVWVYKYKNVNNDSVAYVVWCPTMTDHHIYNMQFNTGHASTTADLVSFAPMQEMMDDTMTTNEMQGVDTLKTSDNNGNISFQISEIPRFVLTTDGDGGTLTDTSAPTPPAPVKKIVIYNGKVVMYNGKLILINTTQ